MPGQNPVPNLVLALWPDHAANRFENLSRELARYRILQSQGYFRTRRFSFRHEGYIGFPPKAFLQNEKAAREFVARIAAIDVTREPTVEVNLYSGIALTEIDLKLFESNGTDIGGVSKLICVRSYQTHDPENQESEKRDLSFFEYPTLDKAVEWYNKSDPQQLFLEDYQKSRDLYKTITQSPHSYVLSCLSLEIGNGELVIGEKTKVFERKNLERIPELEVIPFNPLQARIRASKKKIPKLSNYDNPNSFSFNEGTILDYGYSNFSSDRSSLDFPALLKSLKENPGARELLMLYQGKTGIGIVGYGPVVNVTKVHSQARLTSLHRKEISLAYQKLAERVEGIVGIGLYDAENQVLHRKIDGDFTERAKESIFYLPD